MNERIPLPAAIGEQRLIAVMRRLGTAQVRRVAPILGAAGIGVMEVTLDGAEALDSIRWLAESGYDVGAGTVLTVEEAGAAHAAGAQFLVSPSFNSSLVASAAQSIPIIPGGLTPSEVAAAWDSGASAVKLFPASLGGPEYLAALRGPLAHIPIIPTGGIADGNAAAFLEAGALAVGVGGWLTSQSDLAEVERRAESLVDSIAHLR
jgi:2-dehydro-3-deoxyphosphogluconate aldolase/(4S)-4-hydroxy-2-oxoglutarate aldolase